MAKHIEIIARGVCIRENHLLVCKNIAGGYCYLPGGHVEFGEDSTTALSRELIEEAGEKIRVGELLFVDECRFEQLGRDGVVKSRHEVNLVYRFEIVPRGTKRREVASLEDHIGFEWVPLTVLTRAKFKPASTLRLLRAARHVNP